jgi:hypothetical protein
MSRLIAESRRVQVPTNTQANESHHLTDLNTSPTNSYLNARDLNFLSSFTMAEEKTSFIFRDCVFAIITSGQIDHKRALDVRKRTLIPMHLLISCTSLKES